MKTININSTDLNFEIILHEEHMPIEGQFDDKETEQWVLDEYNSGNDWAWCSVEVRGTYKGLTASDYLGACSYKDKEDFKIGGYYEDMKTTVLNEIREQLEDILKEHCINA